MKNCSYIIWNRTRDLPTCKAVRHRVPPLILCIIRILESWIFGRSAVEGYSRSAGEEILRYPTHSNTWNEQANCYVRNSRSVNPVFASFKERVYMNLPFTAWYTSADEWRREPEQITGARRSKRGLEDGFYCTGYFVFLGSILICRLYKLTLSEKVQVTLQLTVFQI